jgi:hypothetical protein
MDDWLEGRCWTSAVADRDHRSADADHLRVPERAA